MPRYYFHLKSPSRPVRDRTRVELPGLEAAHWHAKRSPIACVSMRRRPARTGDRGRRGNRRRAARGAAKHRADAARAGRAPGTRDFLLLSPWGRGLSATILLAALK
jgi:hypothetical protein